MIAVRNTQNRGTLRRIKRLTIGRVAGDRILTKNGVEYVLGFQGYKSMLITLCRRPLSDNLDDPRDKIQRIERSRYGPNYIRARITNEYTQGTSEYLEASLKLKTPWELS